MNQGIYLIKALVEGTLVNVCEDEQGRGEYKVEDGTLGRLICTWRSNTLPRARIDLWRSRRGVR